jgi:hypothetical protein
MFSMAAEACLVPQKRASRNRRWRQRYWIALLVIAGLDPAIPIISAQRCHTNQDARDKRGHDGRAEDESP